MYVYIDSQEGWTPVRKALWQEYTQRICRCMYNIDSQEGLTPVRKALWQEYTQRICRCMYTLTAKKAGLLLGRLCGKSIHKEFVDVCVHILY